MNYKTPDDYKNPTWPIVYAYGMDWKAHINQQLRDKWEYLVDAEKERISSGAAEIADALSAMDYED